MPTPPSAPYYPCSLSLLPTCRPSPYYFSLHADSTAVQHYTFLLTAASRSPLWELITSAPLAPPVSIGFCKSRACTHTHSSQHTGAWEYFWLAGRPVRPIISLLCTHNKRQLFLWQFPSLKSLLTAPVRYCAIKKNIQNEVEGRSREYSVSSIFLTLTCIKTMSGAAIPFPSTLSWKKKCWVFMMGTTFPPSLLVDFSFVFAGRKCFG